MPLNPPLCLSLSLFPSLPSYPSLSFRSRRPLVSFYFMLTGTNLCSGSPCKLESHAFTCRRSSREQRSIRVAHGPFSKELSFSLFLFSLFPAIRWLFLRRGKEERAKIRTSQVEAWLRDKCCFVSSWSRDEIGDTGCFTSLAILGWIMIVTHDSFK